MMTRGNHDRLSSGLADTVNDLQGTLLEWYELTKDVRWLKGKLLQELSSSPSRSHIEYGMP